MGNENSTLAFRLHPLDDNIEFLGFLGCQHRRGFIQNQDLRLAVELFEYLDTLLFANRQLPDECVGVDLHVVAFAEFVD